MTNRKSRSPVMGPYMEIVDAWLEEDRLLPRKQRHTAARIFQRLRDEYQFPGSERTICETAQDRDGTGTGQNVRTARASAG